MGPAERLETLIRHMDRSESRDCPKGVGLKTAIEARELGLVDFVGTDGNWRYRLTEKGEAYRLSLEGARSRRARRTAIKMPTISLN